jgi:multisubunit Na+/H+ antiporter MnhG subunit
MSTRGIVLTTIGVFLFAMSVLGLFESVHHSAKIFYSVLIPVSAGVVVLGLRSRKAT